MTVRKAWLVFIGLSSILGLAGCGGSKNLSSLPPSSKPTAVLFVSPPPQSLAVNASATLLAAATYPIPSQGGNSQVTWVMTCGSPGACGSFGPSDEGGAITYTAPAAIPAGGTVTVTATAVADTTKSASATITIVAPIPISVAFYAPPPASLQVNAAFTMSASINNDVSANPQVKWTVTCGAGACGSFSSATTGNESQNTYTAPAAIPPGGNVTVTVTSVTDPTKSASTSIIITAAAPTLANGTYVFQISGPTGGQSSFMTGVFVANNGVVTGGEQDWTYYFNDDDSIYPYSSFQKITGGSYATTPDGNLQVTLQIASGGPETFTGTLAAGAHGFVAAIDGSPASGTLDLQTSTAAPAGGYAVSLSGGDESSEAVWIGGILNIDSSGGISGTGSLLDVINSQTNTANTQSLGASTVSAPDANGRVQIHLVPTGSSLPSLYLAGYPIDATHMRLAEMAGSDNSNIPAQWVLGGTALGQGTGTGHFSTTSIGGSSYVFGAQGTNPAGPLQMAGVITLKADGTLTGTFNKSDYNGDPATIPIPVTGNYTVDPTGRVTLSSLVEGSSSEDSLHLYLTGDGNGLLLSNDFSDIFTGQVFQQQTAAFSAASFSGNYGLNATVLSPLSTQIQAGAVTGPLTSNAGNFTDTLAGYADAGGSTADFALSGSLTSNTNGVFAGMLTGFDPTDRTRAGEFTLYLVDSTQAVLIGTDGTQLVLGHLQNVQ
jgi:hypothetical protein